MGESYNRKYNKRGGADRPECFSDPEEYDLRTRVCRDCDWKRPCKILVGKKLRRLEEEEEEVEERDGRHHKRPEDFTERESSGALGFFGSLTVNAGLYAAGVALSEAQFAVNQIPRFPYEDPFAGAIHRGRAKARKAEKDSE